MRLFTEISRNTQSKPYMLSLTECVWDFQNSELWDTHCMPFWALLPLVCPGHRLTFQIFVISMSLVCLLTKGAYLATIFCKQSEKISKKHVRSECKFLTKIEKLRERLGQAKNRTRFVSSRVNDAINLYQSYLGSRLWKTVR